MMKYVRDKKMLKHMSKGELVNLIIQLIDMICEDDEDE